MPEDRFSTLLLRAGYMLVIKHISELAYADAYGPGGR